MKKIAAATLFAAVLVLSAADVNVNGNFKGSKVKTEAPSGWIKNHASNPAIGKGEIAEGKDGAFVLNVKTGTVDTPFYTASPFPVKPGDVVKMSADVTGTGNVSFTCYNYDEKGGYKGSFALTMDEAKVPGTITGSYTVPENVNYTKVRFVFQVKANSDVVVSNVKADISAAK